MDEEIYIGGIAIAHDVIENVIALAVEKVEGVSRVAVLPTGSGVFNLLTGKGNDPVRGIEVRAQGDELYASIRLVVEYGYRFTDIAARARQAAADAILSQLGVDVGAIDIYIDSVITPKE